MSKELPSKKNIIESTLRGLADKWKEQGFNVDENVIRTSGARFEEFLSTNFGPPMARMVGGAGFALPEPSRLIEPEYKIDFIAVQDRSASEYVGLTTSKLENGRVVLEAEGENISNAIWVANVVKAEKVGVVESVKIGSSDTTGKPTIRIRLRARKRSLRGS